MQKTRIEYIDYTWNPIAMRCTSCSPGCDNCWHLRMANRMKMNPTIPENERKALAGEGPCVLRERELDAPLKLRKPSVIGVQFMGDLFHEDVPREWIIDILDIIEKAKQHTFLILTKRSREMFEFFAGSSGAGLNAPSIPNLYPGLTICNQAELDAKIGDFLRVPGKKFISIEPMLGNIFLSRDWIDRARYFETGVIDAVILGGETGPRARPMHPDWVRSVRDQCKAAGVPFYFKQWGAYSPCPYVDSAWKKARAVCIDRFGNLRADSYRDGTRMLRVGSNKAGRLLDGREHNDLPWRVV